ncbi:cupin domain-containing protein [Cryobacterium sp. TMT1-3]|uniref:Cupin domain-containing protein n=1 Tax=Cryobacterium luteum TaxID=1424661 RepID=A0A1H8JK41_9MICO|nr:MULTISPECIES: cupin domain-containing protein [Cryobacterium]TFB83939.1 cupin domain-containing protein [Cryobacterium luteum]TFC25147.1 cupin domain-containing protein [Cryobacterium sp. TMT1-3]SEN80608.1 Cupin domain-containing protein [Cryobacterium luteum]
MATGETQIDNGIFRSTKWTIEPGDAIPMHVHEYEYVVVPMVSETMHVINADGSEIVAEIRAGQSYTRPSGAEHTVENRGSRIIEFVEVEKLA